MLAYEKIEGTEFGRRLNVKKSKLKILFLLHLMLMIYSMSGICSKLASEKSLFSSGFAFYYTCVIVLLGVYAIGWQQIIKRLPLTIAFANKSITVVWGFIWGVLFFREVITLGKVVGAISVIIGVAIFAKADGVAKD